MVKARIYAGIAIIAALGVASMLYVYRGLDEVAGYLAKLENVDAPFSIAAIEMEKNAGEYALGVLQYIAHPDEGTRTEAGNDATDFDRYHGNYMKLSSSPRKLELGRHLAADHRKLTATGKALMAKRDHLDAVYVNVTDLLEQIDRVADDKMVAAAATSEPAHSRTLAAITNIEAEAAELGFWLASFERAPSTLAVKRIHEKIAELDAALAGYAKLPIGATERGLLDAADGLQAKIKTGIDGLLKGNDAMQVLLKEFTRLQVHMDDVSDEEIEPLAVKGLTEPQEMADQTAVRVLTALRYAIPLYLLIALAVGALLILSIARPLRKLASGTRAIGAGELDYRMPAEGNDEFDQVAREFNAMVDRLKETTVSKDLLEASEQKLRATVIDLREEIVERRNAERKQAKLQAELRRSEAMAAMGSLMAGVAHEVRNPLFGISSTLDAMDANPDGGERGQRYREVLRREANRLNKLMTDLLEYGRPPSNEFSRDGIDKVIAEAIRVCAPAATAAEVTLVNDARNVTTPVAMNYGRLLQVFVNLIENAIQHSPAGATVSVRVAAANDEAGETGIACEVSDSGSGFAPEDIPQLFDPFFTRRRKGTGLGLAIVQRIVEEHRGHIEPFNRDHGGATMRVWLPDAPTEG